MSRLFNNNGRLDGVVAYPSNQCTFGAWVKRGASANDVIIHFGTPSSADGFYIQVSSAGVVQGIISAAGSAVTATGSLAINDTTTWHLVVATIQDTGAGALKVTTYVDGANSGTQALTRNPALATVVRIGALLSGIGFLTGRIAHPFRYSALLTPTEIAALFVNVPSDIRADISVFYDSLLNNRNPELDDVGGVELTVTNATYDTDNPPIGPPTILAIGTVQQGASLTITGLRFTTPAVAIGATAQTVNSSSDTSLTINAVSLGATFYGDQPITVTNSLGLSDNLSVPVLPATGFSYVTLTTLTSTAQRLTATPTDLQTGYQIEYETANAQILEDGSFITDSSLTDFDYRVNDGTGFGTSATQTLQSPVVPPVLTGVLPPAIAYFGTPAQISVAGGATGWSSVSEAGTKLVDAGLTLSSGGIITGTPTSAGVISVVIRYTNSDGFVDAAPFVLTIYTIPTTLGTPPNLYLTTHSGVQVVDLQPYFANAINYTIAPVPPPEWDFTEGILTIVPDNAGTYGPYVVTGANPAGTAFVTFTIVIIRESVGRIGFRTQTRRVNERSRVVVDVFFRDMSTGATIVPQSVSYRLDAQHEILGWTDLTPAAEVAITITSAQNAMTSGRNIEYRTLTVAADRGLPSQFVQAISFQLKNQPYST